jgi:hypothetical protein
MTGLSYLGQQLQQLPGFIAQTDPVYVAMMAIGVLLILAAIKTTARFAVWLGLTVLFLLLISPVKGTANP